MSVEANELDSELWTRWQGHRINGVYPLGRCLGYSDHSAVFLTRSEAHPTEVAIKLVPTSRELAELQLPRWKRAGGLAHPHLLRLFEWGGCQLDGLPHLYTVMEYADQTLAQLLLSRAMTEEEARQLLSPTLDALAFLHARGLLQGQLKPSNILVVGDQLKLASDTIRRLNDGLLSTHALTRHDPPEAARGDSSAAGDIWALGVTLFEALGRRPPSGSSESIEAVIVRDLPPAFREVVARCLRHDPQERPTLTQLTDWARGGSLPPLPAAVTQPVPPAPTGPTPPEPAAAPRDPEAHSAAARPASAAPAFPQPRALIVVLLGAIALVALFWAVPRLFRAPAAAVAPAPPAQALPGAQADAARTPAAPQARVPDAPGSAVKPGRTEAATSPTALHEELPEVPSGPRRTIHGHIKVWVRVIVDADGTVSAALVERSGSSDYFRRLATEAARKWTFPPADGASRRVMEIRFDFSRDGTTGHAVTPR